MKYALIILCGVLLLCAIAAYDLNKPKAPQTAHQKVESAYLAAVGGCKTWTQTNSRLAVDEFTDDYELTGTKLKPGHQLVGLDYRTKGAGLALRSRCEYAEQGGQLVLVQAQAGLPIK